MGASLPLGRQAGDGRGDRRIRRGVRPAADASRRGSRQGEHPGRALGIGVAHLRHLHAHDLRRLPAGLHIAGRARRRPRRWRKPVLAGDTLTGRSTVTARRLSQSRRALGFVTPSDSNSSTRAARPCSICKTPACSCGGPPDDPRRIPSSRRDRADRRPPGFSPEAIKAFAVKSRPAALPLSTRPRRKTSVFAASLCASGWRLAGRG